MRIIKVLLVMAVCLAYGCTSETDKLIDKLEKEDLSAMVDQAIVFRSQMMSNKLYVYTDFQSDTLLRRAIDYNLWTHQIDSIWKLTDDSLELDNDRIRQAFDLFKKFDVSNLRVGSNDVVYFWIDKKLYVRLNKAEYDEFLGKERLTHYKGDWYWQEWHSDIFY